MDADGQRDGWEDGYQARQAYAIMRVIGYRGLTYGEVAEAMGVASATVGRWARGETAPKPGQVERLARVVGCDAALFLMPPNRPVPPPPPPLPEYPLEHYLRPGWQPPKRPA